MKKLELYLILMSKKVKEAKEAEKDEIAQLKDDVSELKDMMKQLLEKMNNDG